ncbi:hypothetical protein ACFFQF_16095 [Haladaptatus pallidirubidus]
MLHEPSVFEPFNPHVFGGAESYCLEGEPVPLAPRRYYLVLTSNQRSNALEDFSSSSRTKGR